jgi:hypothetical protein
VAQASCLWTSGRPLIVLLTHYTIKTIKKSRGSLGPRLFRLKKPEPLS